MKSGFPKLKSDTWAIITAFGGWSAVIVTAMLSLHAVTNARIDAQGARIDAQGERLGARIDMLQDTMREEHNALREEHNALRDEHTAMRNEHTLIFESLAGIAQRVSYIEGHLGTGRAADSEPAGLP